MLPGLAFCFFIVYIIDMEKYDYYTIKAAWKGAGVSQRADDIKAAEKIAADLKGNGFLDVVIFGVKAGKREKLEGGKQAKPKAQERTRKAKKPKAQAKEAPKVKTPVNDPKKRKEKAQDNGGQLDLFDDLPNKKNTKNKIMLTHDEIEMVNTCLGLNNVLFSAISIISEEEFKKLKKTFSEAEKTFSSELLELKDNEIRTIALALTKEKNRGDNSFYSKFKLMQLIEFFKKLFS